jgi:DNA-binding FadR family transcriptional regulator
MANPVTIDGRRQSVDLVFRRIQGGNTFEQTVERLLQSIKLGLVGPGEQLPSERDLAASLGVSRVTLREAIRSLQDAGYLQSRRGRNGGTFVLRRPATGTTKGKRSQLLTEAEVEDVFGFRYVIEPGACELASRRKISDDDAAYLRQLHSDCATASVQDFRPADSRLHLAIAALAGVASLAAAVADTRIRLNNLLDAVPLLPVNIEHSNQQHARLINKVINGDAAGARAEMIRHLEGTAALLRGFLT